MDSKQIAAKRGWQTLADGLIIVALIALLTPIVDAIGSAGGWAEFASDWQDWSWTAFQNAFVVGGTALAAWLRRRFVQTPDNDTAETSGA